MKFTWQWMLMILLVGVPNPSRAQCAGMGGGHDHGSGSHSHGAQGVSKNEKKDRQAIQKLLSSEPGRAVALEEIMADRDFMSLLFARVAGLPELRAQALEQFEPGGGARPEGERGADQPPARAPVETAVSYVCPMHSDVISNRPGTCPKCGMTLEKREARRGS